MRPQSWRERSRRALAGALVLGASVSGASGMPVFRHALERWQASDYEIVVFHRGAPDDDAQRLIDQLRAAPARNYANIDVKPIDVSGRMDAAMEDLWTCQTNPAPPWVVVRAPNTSADASPVWSGPLTETLVGAVLDSPARRKIAEGLLRGMSAVWVLLECGDAARDEAAVDTLAGELHRLEKKLALPPPPAAAGLRSPLPLRVAFGLVRVTRNDPAEEFFATTLQHGKALYTARPVAFPVFGRGRMLGGLVGREIAPDEIEQACSSIVAACAAEAKDQNPGRDLLLAANWSSIFDPAAGQLGGAPTTKAVPVGGTPSSTSSASTPSHSGSQTNRKAGVLIAGAILFVASVAAWRLRARSE
ncbi:MAG TPA: hypothetical protein VFT34_18995 [Verrucomicrobiae bacterium]|nr:hypothetical protein [Verrucomicrobiae bacterium]